MEKRFNLKAIFHDGKLDRLVLGDFGPVSDKPKDTITTLSVDSLIAFPIDPELCGVMGIAHNMGCPVTDRLYNNPQFSHE